MKRVPGGKKKIIILSLFIFIFHYCIDTEAPYRTGLGQVPLGAHAPPALLLTHFASCVPGDIKGVSHFWSPLLMKSSKALTRVPAVTRQMSTNKALAGPVPR